ncbi:MAG: nucleotidyltransferase family protein [Variibacter sp.]|nr:nucleotidyltransferase family protein [Variibacter sp.]
MWGIIPAAGRGTRIQPLGFSKELLPVGTRVDGGAETPRAVSEYLVERMIVGGAKRLCFVVSPGKWDIVNYYRGGYGATPISYVIQPQPRGLCDAIFRAAPFVTDGDSVLVGLPDTIWFPADALRALPDDTLSFLLFPVERPQLFDAVVLDEAGRVREIQVKRQDAASRWIWGAFKMPARVLRDLERHWRDRNGEDEYVGTLVNGYLAAGGTAIGVKAGCAYVDVGTLDGYRAALDLLAAAGEPDGQGAVPRGSHPSSRGGRSLASGRGEALA